MPSSRKKSQGKARKAPRSLDQWCLAADVAQRDCGSCRHFDQAEKYSRDDWVECNGLLSQYISDLPNPSSLHYCEAVFRSILGNMRKHYSKYHLFNDRRQRAFREMVLARSTQKCVELANQIDLVEISKAAHPGKYTELLHPWVYMMLFIEICDKYNVSHFNEMKNHPSVIVEFSRIGRVAYDCLREMIRFFHRRNSCDCLKEIYYKLKDSTKRTRFCFGCNQSKDIKEMKECACKSALFCSRECQVAYWPEHKDLCKVVREELEKELAHKMSNLELG